MIVFGLVAFDHALAILHAFASDTENVQNLPSPAKLIQALLKPKSDYDFERLEGIRDAIKRLKHKSHSFYLASGHLEANFALILCFFTPTAASLMILSTMQLQLKRQKHGLKNFKNS
ncbi:bifunctional lycopene cyclase/phytoene synthase [Verruconis gallopava]|uniref:Bifunctional lycopene cyclase/phytoene synthase n=1 Tax=Verruconis gallopava TaxID=253628 RepID=A0A0D2AKK6_9PEZI|nr:bifunctional lycopene cyclase/phytoene synthase [Verruconis gallopava]KIV99508.1 bifunctional lycopene cyclase/phytoene synthase [Verruconis gallopava]